MSFNTFIRAFADRRSRRTNDESARIIRYCRAANSLFVRKMHHRIGIGVTGVSFGSSLRPIATQRFD